MSIKMLTVNKDRSVTLTTDTGNILSMSSALAGVFKEQIMKLDTRDSIRYTCEDLDGDRISLGSLDMTTEEFVDEVFSTFDNDIEFGNYPSIDSIKMAILDTANDYGILIDD